MEETAVLSDLQACLGKDNVERGKFGEHLWEDLQQLFEQWQGTWQYQSPMVFFISVFRPCGRASLALIRPSASGDWMVMRQVPRKIRYLGSNFYSGLAYMTWNTSTDWKIFNLYPREFPEFPSIVFGRIREKEQVGKNIITAVNELFSPGVKWGRSRTRKKLIKGKVPPNNKSLDDQLKSLVNGPHKK